jgi:phosphohistidine phosphatase
MKTLYLNRHAKSSWDNPGLSDFDRPLNNRGKRDAPLMGKILSEKVNSPQVIYSSPANRAITTANQIAESFGYNKNNIIQDQKIYDAVISDIIKIINLTSDEYDTIMFFGHNPTFTMISNYLSNKYIDNLPTCGFVQINFALETWKEVEGNTGKLILFEYPKKHLK